MTDLLLLSATDANRCLPSLTLLSHRVRTVPPTAEGLAQGARADAYLIDGTVDLAGAKRLGQLLNTLGSTVPSMLILTEGGLAVVRPDWHMDTFILSSAGPAEVDARIRLLGREVEEAKPHVLRVGWLEIDERSYTARNRGRTLDLTYKEFELLRYLAAHPDRVFTRERLLSEVWGYDYYGGTRTVDVHVRRLRAKLGDQESLIGTVRGVGYRLQEPHDAADDAGAAPDPGS